MKSRPINLKPWEARAFAIGNKTRITRVVKQQPPEGSTLYVGNYFPVVVGRDGEQRPATREAYGVWSEDGEYACKSPFGQPGDKLWGRETFRLDFDIRIEYDKLTRSTWQLAYGADEPELRKVNWRPSIHMPRWASRITLEVTGLRIERLNDISEADAIAEGCDVDLLASLIAPLANRAVVEPHYWLRNDAGRSFCRKCGEKKVRQINKDCREKNENLDGGWDTEEDGPAFCDTCGVMLDCTYTDHAVRDEIDHFSEYGITSPADAHSLETALHVHGNPRLTKSCGTFHYRPELTGTVAKICFRHLWESINGPDSWDANPWVWVVEFKQKECN